ncbi:MAG: NADH-quinone oxidoreductase subunit L, partial [candidate division Zixibacteria bacterium]|nr:NADH-quinone oxidoreductase subunit L [candidate division Zixibacteria bacterium]
MILDELQEMAQKASEQYETAEHHVHVCVAAGCVSSGSREVLEALTAEVEKRELGGKCVVKGVGCMGPCAGGPVVLVESEKIMYNNVSAADAPDIIENLGSGPVERLAIDLNAPFFTRQQKIVLENCGIINPESIEDYLINEGYFALGEVLTSYTAGDIIEQIMKSGLRGRGGAGYPTGLKWSTVAKAGGSRKFIVCNADEGDPGAFMDRSVLESDPHRVLEGMAIAAIAVGANEGYIYVRAEYPLAIDRLKKAIRQAERAGILGNRVLGTTHDFHIHIRLGAGAFVCGEETALLASIEGSRGTPRHRPPYPAESGLWKQSTLINNVETFANIPTIIRKGAEWYSKIGTDDSKGTKVFALAGRINNTGLIEVPMGMTLREIIFDIGGGIPDGRIFKAVQTGGPSGGCIPEKHLDKPVDYKTLTELGSIMGSGGMIVMDETSNMVDVARYFMEFSRSESCGKCVPCRVGTVHTYNILEKLLEGEGDEDDIARLE